MLRKFLMCYFVWMVLLTGCKTDKNNDYIMVNNNYKIEQLHAIKFGLQQQGTHLNNEINYYLLTKNSLVRIRMDTDGNSNVYPCDDREFKFAEILLDSISLNDFKEQSSQYKLKLPNNDEQQFFIEITMDTLGIEKKSFINKDFKSNKKEKLIWNVISFLKNN